jgi:hypothetical protein
MVEDKRTAIPFEKRPPNLDGSLPGDVGFDPAGFSNNPPRAWLIGGEERSLKWYREAEIVHSRAAMLATIGFITPEFFHLPGNAELGPNVFANTNPIQAIQQVPQAGLWQIAVTIGAIEFWRINRVIRGEKEPGDLGLGQGEGRWNPFGFNYDEDEYKAMQTREVKNGRLAMFGIIGMILQCRNTGVGVITQLRELFSYPDDSAVVGNFLEKNAD